MLEWGDEGGVEEEGGSAVEGGVVDAGEKEFEGEAAAGFGAEVDGGGARMEAGEVGLFVVAGDEVEVVAGCKVFALGGGVSEGAHVVGGKKEAGGALAFGNGGEFGDEALHGSLGMEGCFSFLGGEEGGFGTLAASGVEEGVEADLVRGILMVDGEGGEVAVGALDEVLGGDAADGFIAGEDGVDASFFVGGEPERGDLTRAAGEVRAGTQAVEEEAVEVAGGNPVGEGVGFVEGNEGDGDVLFESGAAGAFVDGGDESGVFGEGVVEGEQGDVVAAGAAQRSDVLAGATARRGSEVLEFSDGFADSSFGPGADAGTAVDNARDRGVGDFRTAGDVGHGGGFVRCGHLGTKRIAYFMQKINE